MELLVNIKIKWGCNEITFYEVDFVQLHFWLMIISCIANAKKSTYIILHYHDIVYISIKTFKITWYHSYVSSYSSVWISIISRRLSIFLIEYDILNCLVERIDNNLLEIAIDECLFFFRGRHICIFLFSFWRLW